MKRLFIPLILFLLVVLEGVAIGLLPERLLTSSYLIVPHWVFIALALLSIFYDSYDTVNAVIYAAVFGLLIDIVYTDLLGVYMFSYAVGIFVVHLLKRLLIENLLLTILMTVIGLMVTEVIIVAAYTLADSINNPVQSIVIDRFLPTLIANLIFLLILYPLVTKTLLKLRKQYISDF
ncbi:MAG TPA: rod shape-determining protein MreD [Pseudogracilibacillus sp.]|nr:rod shape-determining protein MreD [Pseudogracilibacillus sp.]